MAYSSLADLQALLPADELIKLSNDTPGATEIDTDTIDEVIASADSVIDGYAGAKETVPLDPVPGMVKTISANLAVYFLYRRRSMVPEIWSDQYKTDLATLIKISEGKVALRSKTKKTDAPQQALTNSSKKVMGGPGGLLEGF